MKMGSKEVVALNIAKFRIEKGMSRAWLARKMKVHAEYIQKVENGDVGITTDSIDKFAEALKVEPYKLFIDWSAMRGAIREADKKRGLLNEK